MTLQLDIHPASQDERRAAFANVHEVWGRGLTLEEHLERRLNSPAHNWARWYVGTLAGEVVTSLGAYPVEFFVGANRLPGIAIGSVHTRPDHRGHGYAPQLLAAVERAEESTGALISVLYSDIPPAYYARLGYVECPAHSAWAEPGTVKPAGRFEFQEVDPRSELDRLMAAYDRCLADSPLAIARSRDYWENILARRPDDVFCWISGSGGSEAGYLRLAETSRSVHFVDMAVSPPVPSRLESFYRDAAHHAHSRFDKRAGGWLPDTATVRASFTVEPRSREITMVKTLDGGPVVDQAAIEAGGEFLEIDHV